MMQLNVYRDALVVIAGVARLGERIRRRDPDLARQLRRAAPSIALNIAEGETAIGGNRRLRFDTAIGSAKETVACLEVAVAMTYLPQRDIEASVDGLGRVVATLVKLQRRG